MVTGVSGSKYALGFFGYAYYAENKDKLKVVSIDGGKGPVSPTEKSINDGSYSPLSRPIFIYVNPESAKRPEVDAFVNFYLKNSSSLAGEVGYVALPDELLIKAINRYTNKITGKWF